MRTLPLLLLCACGGDAWHGADTLRLGRWGHTATALSDGSVLVVGGFGPSRETLPLVERWDAARDLWSEAAPLAQARAFHTATPLPDGRVLVIGGAVGDLAIRDVAVFDPGSSTWTEAAPLARGRARHTATLLDDGAVLVHGGFTDPSGPGPVRYDPAADTWTELEVDALHRDAHGAAKVPGGVLVVGGFGPEDRVQEDAWVLGAAGDSWSEAGRLWVPRASFAIAGLSSGDVLLFGGATSRAPDPGEAIGGVERWRDGELAPAGDLLEARFSATATVTPSDAVLVVGGGTGGFGALSSVEIWDPALDALVEAHPMSDRRFHHGATWLPDGRLFVVGGWNGVAAITSTEIYTPAARYR